VLRLLSHTKYDANQPTV